MESPGCFMPSRRGSPTRSRDRTSARNHHQEPMEYQLEVLSLERDLNENGKNILKEITRLVNDNMPMITKLTVEAMKELLLMAKEGEPLWSEGALNLEEYERKFQNGVGPRLDGFRTEASRKSAVVAGNPEFIRGMFMLTNFWSTIFVGMVNRANEHEEILANLTGDGALLLMSMEYLLLSPLVSTRESYFLRYCKEQEDGAWAVFDVSIDHLLPNVQPKYRRRPSGCLIQKATNGCSRVTWVEHVEVNDSDEADHIFRPLISSGQAFGANRWVTTLERQCERMDRITTRNSSLDLAGKICLKITTRIARNFFLGLTPSMGSSIFGYAGDDIRVMAMHNIDDPGRPLRLILCVATSFWVPVAPKTVFDFLRDENNRTKWDVHCTEGIMQKIREIPSEKENGICVTLLKNANSCYNKRVLLQETSSDSTASFVIYAFVDPAALLLVLSGSDDPNHMGLLPSGFAIFPDGMAEGNGGGSLLTVSFQVLVGTDSLIRDAIATVENQIRTTVMKIKASFPSMTA